MKRKPEKKKDLNKTYCKPFSSPFFLVFLLAFVLCLNMAGAKKGYWHPIYTSDLFYDTGCVSIEQDTINEEPINLQGFSEPNKPEDKFSVPYFLMEYGYGSKSTGGIYSTVPFFIEVNHEFCLPTTIHANEAYEICKTKLEEGDVFDNGTSLDEEDINFLCNKLGIKLPAGRKPEGESKNKSISKSGEVDNIDSCFLVYQPAHLNKIDERKTGYLLQIRWFGKQNCPSFNLRFKNYSFGGEEQVPVLTSRQVEPSQEWSKFETKSHHTVIDLCDGRPCTCSKYTLEGSLPSYFTIHPTSLTKEDDDICSQTLKFNTLKSEIENMLLNNHNKMMSENNWLLRKNTSLKLYPRFDIKNEEGYFCYVFETTLPLPETIEDEQINVLYDIQNDFLPLNKVFYLASKPYINTCRLPTKTGDEINKHYVLTQLSPAGSTSKSKTPASIQLKYSDGMVISLEGKHRTHPFFLELDNIQQEHSKDKKKKNTKSMPVISGDVHLKNMLNNLYNAAIECEKGRVDNDILLFLDIGTVKGKKDDAEVVELACSLVKLIYKSPKILKVYVKIDDVGAAELLKILEQTGHTFDVRTGNIDIVPSFDWDASYLSLVQGSINSGEHKPEDLSWALEYKVTNHNLFFPKLLHPLILMKLGSPTDKVEYIERSNTSSGYTSDFKEDENKDTKISVFRFALKPKIFGSGGYFTANGATRNALDDLYPFLDLENLSLIGYNEKHPEWGEFENFIRIEDRDSDWFEPSLCKCWQKVIMFSWLPLSFLTIACSLLSWFFRRYLYFYLVFSKKNTTTHKNELLSVSSLLRSPSIEESSVGKNDIRIRFFESNPSQVPLGKRDDDEENKIETLKLKEGFFKKNQVGKYDLGKFILSTIELKNNANDIKTIDLFKGKEFEGETDESRRCTVKLYRLPLRRRLGKFLAMKIIQKGSRIPKTGLRPPLLKGKTLWVGGKTVWIYMGMNEWIALKPSRKVREIQKSDEYDQICESSDSKNIMYLRDISYFNQIKTTLKEVEGGSNSLEKDLYTKMPYAMISSQGECEEKKVVQKNSEEPESCFMTEGANSSHLIDDSRTTLKFLGQQQGDFGFFTNGSVQIENVSPMSTDYQKVNNSSNQEGSYNGYEIQLGEEACPNQLESSSWLQKKYLENFIKSHPDKDVFLKEKFSDILIPAKLHFFCLPVFLAIASFVLYWLFLFSTGIFLIWYSSFLSGNLQAGLVLFYIIMGSLLPVFGFGSLTKYRYSLWIFKIGKALLEAKGMPEP